MSQPFQWYRNAESSKPVLKRRVQRLTQIIFHPRDAWLLIRLVSWAFVLPLLKRTVSLKKLAPFMWRHPRDPADPHIEQKIATVVRWIYIFIFCAETSCLERSLLLYRFLSRNGSDPRLVTGMRRTEQGEWKGHAWIELNSTPFEESSTHVQDFRALIFFGRKGAMWQASSGSTETTQ